MNHKTSQSQPKDKTIIIAAIIAGAFSCFAAVIGLGTPIVQNLANRYIPVSSPVPSTLGNIPTSAPTHLSNTIIPQQTTLVASNSFIASSPLVINGVSYSVPNSNSQFCVANQQSGIIPSGVEYDLKVPKGWVIVWNSEEADWPGGYYANYGLLIVYGNFEGKVTIVDGEYCAVPIEWKDFAVNLRANAILGKSLPQFSIGEVP